MTRTSSSRAPRRSATTPTAAATRPSPPVPNTAPTAACPVTRYGRAVAIEAVLFDFNGVLTTSPFTLIGELGGASGGLEPQVVLDLMMGPYDEDTDHGWHRFERGEITAGDYGLDLLERATAAGVEIDFGALNGVMGRLVV